MFLNINRNKRSITLDLKKPAGRELLLKIAATADVVVQNFRPGVVERLGVGYEDIAQVSPGIVYLSLSGFGEQGPWVHKPVYDPVIQAISGLTTIQAGSDAERPRLVRTVLPDKFSAMAASQAIGAALFRRERTGGRAARAPVDAGCDPVVSLGVGFRRADLSRRGGCPIRRRPASSISSTGPGTDS